MIGRASALIVCARTASLRFVGARAPHDVGALTTVLLWRQTRLGFAKFESSRARARTHNIERSIDASQTVEPDARL